MVVPGMPCIWAIMITLVYKPTYNFVTPFVKNT